METRLVHLLYLFLLGTRAYGSEQFSFESVRAKARATAQQTYVPVAMRVPENWRRLDYQQIESIRFRADHALWAGLNLPFTVEFFLPGPGHEDRVAIHEVSSDGVRPVPYSPAAFSTGTNSVVLPESLGYAGMRLVYKDESSGGARSLLCFWEGRIIE